MKPIRFAVCLLKETFDKLNPLPTDYFLGLKVFLNVKNWKDYYLDCKKKSNKKLIIYLMKNKLNFITRTHTADRSIFAEIVFGNEYFTKNLVLPKKAVVFDIGAHIGVFSVFISSRAEKIFAFEPVPENYNLLLQNIKLNNLEKKVFPFNLAVSNKKGEETIFLHKFNTGGNSIYQRPGRGMLKKIEVKATTLTDIFRQNKIEKCDLMKIDIEGGEYNLLFNLPKEALNKVKLISMECHRFGENQNNPKKLIEFLEEKGFEIKKKREIFGMVLILAEQKAG